MQMRRITSIYILAAGLAAAPMAGAEESATSKGQQTATTVGGEMLPGRAIAEKLCSRCHAVGSEGASPFAEAPPFREIVKRYPPSDLQEALGEGISVGHEAMPEFRFEAEDVGAIITYLESLAAGE